MNIPLRFSALTLALVALLLNGCATRPQNILLDPPVKVAPSSVGNGKIVWVRVKDTRLTKTLGVVGDLQGRYSHVSIDDDFSNTVYQRVSAALRDLGFKAQPTPGPDERELVIEVRDMKYQSVKQGLAFETETSVEIAALARTGRDRYERLYRAGERQTNALLPDEKARAETVNRTVAATLEDMLADSRLIALLVK